MTPDEIKALIATVLAEGGYVKAADLPAPVDLSAYVLKTDVADLSAYALKTDLPAPVNTADFVRKASPEAYGEIRRKGMWIDRVLSKFHSNERPTDADLSEANGG